MNTLSLLGNVGLNDDFDVTHNQAQAALISVGQRQQASAQAQSETQNILHDLQPHFERVAKTSQEALLQNANNKRTINQREEERKKVKACSIDEKDPAEKCKSQKIIEHVRNCLRSATISCAQHPKAITFILLTTSSGFAAGKLLFKTPSAALTGGCVGFFVGCMGVYAFYSTDKLISSSPIKKSSV